MDIQNCSCPEYSCKMPGQKCQAFQQVCRNRIRTCHFLRQVCRIGAQVCKTVTEDVKPGLYANLACADPGSVKCAFKNPPQLVTTELSASDLESIDANINTRISEGNFTGSFTFSNAAMNKYLVIFEANAEQGKIDYIIYTQAEAAQQGYEI